MHALKSTNLALAFILELAMLAALAYWGIHTGSTTLAKVLLAFGVPFLAATVWGLFVAPRSSMPLQGAPYLALKVVLVGLAVVGLIVAGPRVAGIVLAVVFIVNTILLYVWQ